MGVLPEDFPFVRVRMFRLDGERMIAKFSENIEIPLRPFFGSMGVAPPRELGRIHSAPPWIQVWGTSSLTRFFLEDDLAGDHPAEVGDQDHYPQGCDP